MLVEAANENDAIRGIHRGGSVSVKAAAPAESTYNSHTASPQQRSSPILQTSPTFSTRTSPCNSAPTTTPSTPTSTHEFQLERVRDLLNAARLLSASSAATENTSTSSVPFSEIQVPQLVSKLLKAQKASPPKLKRKFLEDESFLVSGWNIKAARFAQKSLHTKFKTNSFRIAMSYAPAPIYAAPAPLTTSAAATTTVATTTVATTTLQPLPAAVTPTCTATPTPTPTAAVYTAPVVPKTTATPAAVRSSTVQIFSTAAMAVLALFY
ncbi:hypothetical protein BDR26DRAFT_1012246 [Obelidium mucronatum]|nr:hypothetical protein BDR26DRAFT_1012246 [Obelidium mucronatum]